MVKVGQVHDGPLDRGFDSVPIKVNRQLPKKLDMDFQIFLSIEAGP
jgi:hypothetical protein